MENKEIAVFWFRRDVRLFDNVGLSSALQSGLPVLPIFIFDDAILSQLDKDDARVSFIYECLASIQKELEAKNSSLLVKKGNPLAVWKSLLQEFNIKKVFFNKDYEPYAIKRDKEVIDVLLKNGVSAYAYKDQVIFEKSEVTKDDGNPYTVYTPYKKKWLSYFNSPEFKFPDADCAIDNFLPLKADFPTLESIDFTKSPIKVKPYTFKGVDTYNEHRDFPAKDATSYLSPHLRFGTVSVRELVKIAQQRNDTFLSELIWREFFMQILYHFPKVVAQSFRAKYDNIQWRNNEAEFEQWCKGETGYPMVDAGMRQLNETGYMHNRVRMVVASFLCKHLLIDWRWGEAYFAKKLLDYDLSANNGNWQWAAGTGCDAAPYFRVFNPTSQLEKFDKGLHYIRTWVKDFDELTYPKPIVDHKMARERAIAMYKEGISSF